MDELDLQTRMDELADTEIQRDMVLAERETLKQKQVPANIQAELQQIDEEFAPKIEQIELNIKARKDQLQSMLKEYAQPVKSKFYSWSYDEEVIWDAKGLDGYALSHPEILYMRSTNPKTRLTPKKSKI